MYIRAGDYVYTCGKVVRQECWGGILQYCIANAFMGRGAWLDERKIEGMYYISIYILYY